jgi:hypothetical protein
VKLSAPLDAEIVVINNASDDDTAVLSQWAGKSQFPACAARVLRQKPPASVRREDWSPRVNPMLVRKEAKACGIVLYGIVLGLVLALPGCNANWPPIGSKEEAKLLARIPHSTEAGGRNNAGEW